MDSDFTIDLNQPPLIIDHELPTNEGEIPISVTSSSPGIFVIELNEDNNEIGYPVIEFDLNEFREDDNDGVFSDSSVDEHVTQHTGDATTFEETGNGQQTDNVRRRKRKVLTDAERWKFYRALLAKSVNGKLKKNTTKEVQHMFNIENIRTIQRIWKIHKKTPPGTDVDVSLRKVRNCGRKRIEVDLSRVKEIALHQRTTLTSLSDALGVSYSKLYHLFKSIDLNPQCCSIDLNPQCCSI